MNAGIAGTIAIGVFLGWIPCDVRADAPDPIPLYTADLDARVQSWCPRPCVDAPPFVASYPPVHGQRLVFVAARHAFTPRSRTMRAVAIGFSRAAPGIVILEGFPTAMGENPAPLVKKALEYGTRNADEYARGENMYAASLALRSHVPFVGGEPTRGEQLKVFTGLGFANADVCFAYMVGSFVQALRAGTLEAPGDARFREAYAVWAQGFRDQYALEPLSPGEFAQVYRATFGVAYAGDKHLSTRADPGTSSMVGRIKQAEMHIRDEHLLGLIRKYLDGGKSVLVVYGGSHWSTLSAALELELGKPGIRVIR
ncbi:MAG: hypothetical protein JSS29_05015 [Proteobacteria bacterium]|nr:hypothetical protein [Pseudomonadota bacterium]